MVLLASTLRLCLELDMATLDAYSIRVRPSISDFSDQGDQKHLILYQILLQFYSSKALNDFLVLIKGRREYRFCQVPFKFVHPRFDLVDHFWKQFSFLKRISV